MLCHAFESQLGLNRVMTKQMLNTLKVIEKHVTKRSFAYLNKYKFLHEVQSSFRKHHSCQTALIKLIYDCLSHIDEELCWSNILRPQKSF